MIDEAFLVNLIKQHERKISNLEREIRELRAGRSGNRGHEIEIHEGVTKARFAMTIREDSEGVAWAVPILLR